MAIVNWQYAVLYVYQTQAQLIVFDLIVAVSKFIVSCCPLSSTQCIVLELT